MSVNYYFKYMLFGLEHELHIGKASVGWKPVFRRTEFYSTVREIKKFYNKNKKYVKIVNEYGDELTWDELKKELIFWNKDNLNVFVRERKWYDYKDQDGYEFIKSDFI